MKTLRKTAVPALCLAAFAALVVGCDRTKDKRTLEGQVFIRTKGGDNIRLSLVDVLLFDEKVIVKHIEKKREVAKPILDAFKPLVEEAAREKSDSYYQRIRGMSAFPLSAFYYFTELPIAHQWTKTDGDGKFSFKVPSGSYALIAISSREAGTNTEFYWWMVRATVAADTKVMLANDNLSSSGSTESLVHTREDKSFVAIAMEGRGGITGLKAFIEDEKRVRAAAEAARRAGETAAKERERQAGHLRDSD